MTGVFILSHIEKYASISFITGNCFPVMKKTLRGNVPRHILFKGHSAYAWKSGFMHNISKMLSTDFDEFHPIGMVL